MTEREIFDFLKKQGLSNAGVAGVMGNMFAESGLKPNNLQNSFEKRLGHTDISYTKAVDNGTYKNFSKDSAGYGLCQWTYPTRKAALLAFAKAEKASVGDAEMQLRFFVKELKESFSGVLSTLKTATTVREASDVMLLKFERPADQSEKVRKLRASYGQSYYQKFAGKESAMNYTNSPLVSYTKISPNRTPNRNHAIDTITIHCIVGQWTAKQGCDYFASTDRQCSANYVVGKDGSIGLSVDEKDRAWCSGGKDKNGKPIRVNGISGADNDHRAVTIEVASDTTHPYKVNDKAYAALIELVADICKRNGIKELKWKADKSLIGKVDQQNMTVHRWFANKSCPGDYLYNLHGDIARKVNAKLGVAADTSTPVKDEPAVKPNVPYKVHIKISNLNIRSGAGTNYSAKGVIAPGVYTIVNEASGKGATKWGKLKSGAGWISLDYCEKL